DGHRRTTRLGGRHNIAGRKGDENIAAAVGAIAADPGKAGSGPTGQALALRWNQGRVGRQHDDDRALVARYRKGRWNHFRTDHFADGNAAAFEQTPAAVVGLHERADSVSSIADRHATRRGANAALE